ncbi:MAG: ArsR family transcriptional regulator [Candidatus Micrarchaeota archaeon]|nr:ArsR family transcriptional regulator [Candidatus Micrarchaeota archaeon]
MGRTGDSKNSILRSISKGDKTLSDICNELGLAPATVSQHLKELESDGMIERVENSHIRKWKYYRISGEVANNNYGENMNDNRRRLLYYGGTAVGIVIIAYVLLSLTQFSSGGIGAQQYVPIRLTDPPHVPIGTQALEINYSSIKVHVSGAGNTSGWIASNSSGSINLMTLLNVSQTIGSVGVPKNSTLDMIRFTISTATITINNTVYSVTVPSANVTARLDGNSRIGSSSGVLLDLSPTVATIFTDNATIFVMVPSLKAVVVPGANATTRIGHRESLSQNESGALESNGQSIVITNVTLTKTGNSTTLMVSVKNTGNRSVEIKHVLLYGNETAIISAPGIVAQNGTNGRETRAVEKNDRPSFSGSGVSAASLEGSGNSSGDSTIGVAASANATEVGGLNKGNHSEGVNAGADANVSGENASTGDNASAGIEQNSSNGKNESENRTARNVSREREIEGVNAMNITSVVRTIVQLRNINFLVGGNSTLVLPFSEGQFEANGFELAANTSATFSFSGNIVLGNGNIEVSPIAGQSYSVVVSGEEGASANATIVATGN